jgi:hypothetical protein
MKIMNLLRRKFQALIGISRVYRENEKLHIQIGELALIASAAKRNHFRYLWDAEVKVFSQWGEDGILAYLCDIIDIAKPKVLELGAGNFTECNSKSLAIYRNASAYVVDGTLDLVNKVRESDLMWKNHIFAEATWVTTDNVVAIMERAKKSMSGLDILSIDLDGNDYWIMRKLDLSSLKIVVVEFNPLFGIKKALVVPEDNAFVRERAHFSNLYYGASILAWIDLLAKRDFSLIGTNRVGNNAFFIKTDLRDSFDLKVPPIERYLDWRIRESRDKNDNLNFLNRDEALAQISNLEVIDIETGKTHQLGDVVS